GGLTGAVRRVVEVTACLPGGVRGDRTGRLAFRLCLERGPQLLAEHPHCVGVRVLAGAAWHGGTGELAKAREGLLVPWRAGLGQAAGDGLDDGGELRPGHGAQSAGGDAVDRGRVHRVGGVGCRLVISWPAEGVSPASQRVPAAAARASAKWAPATFSHRSWSPARAAMIAQEARM